MIITYTCMRVGLFFSERENESERERWRVCVCVCERERERHGIQRLHDVGPLSEGEDGKHTAK